MTCSIFCSSFVLTNHEKPQLPKPPLHGTVKGRKKGKGYEPDKHSKTDIPLTLRESVKDAFAERGLSISQWARKHNLAPQYVYDLLNGRTNGARGESHRAAVLLGLKEGVIEERAAS